MVSVENAFGPATSNKERKNALERARRHAGSLIIDEELLVR
jgi:hypothetical protein